MSTTSLHIKIEADMKDQAQKIASDLGLSLSAVTKALLRQFIRTKRLAIGDEEIPNARLMKMIRESDEDIKKGRVTSFKNKKEVLDFLKSEIKDEKSPRVAN